MNAEVLLMFVLDVNRAYLYAHPDRELTLEEEARYDEVLAQRANDLPSQYITGHQEFWGLDLIVSPAVLIPRPETEHLVEAALELARGVPHPRIVDVGTGSGCVALALAHELPDAQVYAVDLSADALEIARANAVRLQLDQRVRFLQCDVLQPERDEGSTVIVSFPAVIANSPAAIANSPAVIPMSAAEACPERSRRALAGVMERLSASRGTCGEEFCEFDFVVSNPPYVAFSEADKVQKSVFAFEPRIAVFAGEHGLDMIRPLIEQAYAALKPGGWLALEIGYSMRDTVLSLLSPTMWEDIRVVPDLQGIPRVVAAKRKF